MGIKHLFVSAVSDSPDATRVRPSNWNAEHTIDGDVDFNGHSITNVTLGTTLPVAQGGTGQTTEAEALGEMTQALTALSGDTSDIDWDTDYLPVYDGSADTGKKATLYSLGVRDRLMPPRIATPTYSSSDAREFYIRTPAVSVTLTNASPCVVTWSSHGLQAGDPVVFTKPWDARHAATVTIASPAVVSYTTHGYTTGDPFKFNTSGALPTGITAGTTYYVIATGLAADSFQFSATSGGAAVNTSGSQSGSHVLRRVSALPSGVTEGTIYYVISAGLLTNSFQFSTVAGGSAVNTSSAQAGKITAQTGNDNNDGTAADRAHAMLTVAIAWQKRMCGELDTSSYNVNWNLADGAYDGSQYQTGFATEGSSILIDGADATWTGGGSCNWFGNLNDRTAVRFINCNQIIYVGDVNLLGGQMVLRSVCIEETTQTPITMYGGQLVLNSVDFANSKTHMAVRENCSLHVYGFATIWPESTGSGAHFIVSRGGFVEYGQSIFTYGTVNFTSAFATNWTSTGTTTRCGGMIEVWGDLSGAVNVTGKRFTFSQGVSVQGYNDGLNIFPGNQDGVLVNGAMYDTNMGFGSGQVLNWNAGDVTITHSANTLTMAGGAFVHGNPPVVPSYTVVGVPSASPAGQLAYISNETGGAVLAFSDAANWRRVTDRNVIS